MLPVHNGARYLAAAIESILAQSFGDFELLLIDDGSTDESWSLICDYADRDRRIVVRQNDRNIGLTHTLNRGLALARGELLARQDADDISLPQRLACQVELLDRRPEVGVVGCAVQLIDSTGTPGVVLQVPGTPGWLAWNLFFANPLVHSSVMLRRSVYAQTGGYSIEWFYAQDYDLWQRASDCIRLANIPEVLLYLRKHEASVSGQNLARQQQVSIDISRRLMERRLRRTVPREPVERLWTQQYAGIEEAFPVARLILRLAKASLRDRALSAEERRLIRRDAARRILALPRAGRRGWRKLLLLAMVWRLDGGQVYRALRQSGLYRQLALRGK